jgi:hypothetical protein
MQVPEVKVIPKYFGKVKVILSELVKTRLTFYSSISTRRLPQEIVLSRSIYLVAIALNLAKLCHNHLKRKQNCQ